MVIKKILLYFCFLSLFFFVDSRLVFGADDDLLYNKKNDIYYEIYEEYSEKKDSYYESFEENSSLSPEETLKKIEEKHNKKIAFWDEKILEKSVEEESPGEAFLKSILETAEIPTQHIPLKERVQDEIYQSVFLLESYYINVEGKSKVYHGSGALISPNIIITAAHNLYNSLEGGYPDRIDCFQACFRSKFLSQVTVLPKKNKNSVYVPPCRLDEAQNQNSFEYEGIGLIICDQFKLLNFSRPYVFTKDIELLENQPIRITGYVGGERVAYNSLGKITSIHKEKSICYHDAPTKKGESGSGIFFEKEGQIYCLGVHVYSRLNLDNAGVLIDKGVEEKINEITLNLKATQVLRMKKY